MRPSAARPSLDDMPVAEVDLDLPIEERAASRGRRDRGRAEVVAAPARTRSGQASSLLAARAAEEYHYVVRDVRRIGLVGGGIVAILAILFVLIDVLHVVPGI